MYRAHNLRNSSQTLNHTPSHTSTTSNNNSNNNTNTPQSTSGPLMPPSHSSSSLSSSFSSDAASSMLLRAGPSNSSQSDILDSDHPPISSPSPSYPSKNKFFPLSISPTPRSAPLAHMGQGASRTASVPPSVPHTPSSSTSPSASHIHALPPTTHGGMFRRWHGRRRKSEDASVVFAAAGAVDDLLSAQITKGKERELSSTSSAAQQGAGAQVLPITSNLPPPSKPSKHLFSSAQLSSFNVFSSKKHNHHFNAHPPPKSPKFGGSAPLPPPKPTELKGKKLPSSAGGVVESKSSPITILNEKKLVSPSPSPGSTTYLPPTTATAATTTGRQPRERERERDTDSSTSLSSSSGKEKPDYDTKQDWRKSDSTMTSHGTIRPGGGLGNRSPRPVSLAESSHSGHTVVPVNKRLSALITDAEFVMPEEGDLADTDQEKPLSFSTASFTSITSAATSTSHANAMGSSGKQATTPASSPNSKTRNRRSMSLGTPIYFQRSKPSTPEPTLESNNPISRTLTDTPSLSSSTQTGSRDSATLTKASAKGFIAPTTAPGAAHSTGSNIRSRLAAWTSAANRSERPLSPPPVHPRRGASALVGTPSSAPHSSASTMPSSHPSFRQTAVSMTGGLAPAAGIAMGIGKRAAEKVHRVWGGLSSSSSSNSGYSSSSSVGTGTAPSSYNSSRHSEHVLGMGVGMGMGMGVGTGKVSSSDLSVGNSQSSQTTSNTAGGGWGKGRRRTPNAPSGSWSMASSATSSVSDSDGLAKPAGPSLGTLLRGPKKTRSGANVAGGLVFGRDLQTCVLETAIEGVQSKRKLGSPTEKGPIKPLDERLLPALVVRCAEHLKMWGIQEEGLFRVSGRHAHVAKLRSEFDTGADYNLSEADPGELDPHAVASIFKAYLRELPQSILTSSLVSHFESALASEGDDDGSTSALAAVPKMGMGSKNPSLPVGPKAAVPSALALRKPPSLSTLALPSFAGLRATSEASLEALGVLIALLPAENRDLLYTVVELIQLTAEKSKDTKMPLGNLLLVFCPSLNMSPTLLRVLCEAKNIWNGPPPKAPSKPLGPAGSSADVQTPTVSSVLAKITTPIVEEDGEGGSKPSANLRVAVSALERSSSAQSDSPHDDRDSYVSALDSTEGATQPSSPTSDCVNLPRLSSSTDSIATPSTLSEEPPMTPAMSGKPFIAKVSESSSYSRSPTLAEHIEAQHIESPLSSPPRRPVVSAPVPFPSTGTGAPHSPVSNRKSFTLLSFPPMRQQQDTTPTSQVSSPPLMTRRSKRPSLTLLFSKKSSSPLRNAPESAAPNSAPILPSYSVPNILQTPTPLSPTSSIRIRTLAPPVLDTNISSSPIQFAFDQIPGLISISEGTIATPSPFPITDDSDSRMPGVRVRADSSSSSVYNTPQSTPQSIDPSARSRFSSLILPPSNPSLLTASPSSKVSRSPSQSSLTPSIDVGLERSNEGDWAKSVLLAAHAESPASQSCLSVKEAIKVFEGK